MDAGRPGGGLCVASVAAQPVPLGPETSLDPAPADYFHCPALAGQDDGSFAAAWGRVHDYSHVFSDAEIVVRTANADGVLDAAHNVARQPYRFSGVRLDFATCATAAAAGDTWVIAWEADNRASDGSPYAERLFVRRFGR